jgi:hypothetical protein
MQYEILVMMLWIDGNDGYDDWLMAYPSPFEIHISSAFFICSDGSDMGRETHIMSVVMNWWCQFSLRSFASWLYQDRDRSIQDPRHQAIQVFLGFPNPKLEPQPIQRMATGLPMVAQKTMKDTPLLTGEMIHHGNWKDPLRHLELCKW